MNLADLSLEQKIGQMIIAGFPSPQIDEHFKKVVQQYHIGNIVLFTRNLKDKREIASLTREIQRSMMKSNGVPALISTDQEGGMVARLNGGTTLLSGHMAIGASHDPGNAFQIGEIAGLELRALGININLAPVVDVNNNPLNPVIGVRSFGEDPQFVAEYAVNYASGLQKARVCSTAKHFPGHGDTAVDSHFDLPSVKHAWERLEQVELLPFRAMIEAKIEAIMTAHILFPALEPEKIPATLSSRILTGLLREKMGFEGLIITDCMEMKAIATNFGTVQGAVEAIKAGADLVCISHTMGLQIAAVEKLLEAVRTGEISEQRIDESVSRILALKEKYGLFANPYPDDLAVEQTVGCDAHVQASVKISLESITLVKDELNLLPVRSGNIFVVAPEPVNLTIVEDERKLKTSFAPAIAAALGGSSALIPLNPSEEEIEQIIDQAGKSRLVVVGTYNAMVNEGQQRMVKRLAERGNVMVVSLRNPYDLRCFPEVPTYLCAYEYTPLSVASVVRVLRGEVRATGCLPVTI